MNFKFTKMHGAGNDFVVVDDTKQTFPTNNCAAIAAITTRRTGIGCEGLIIVRPADDKNNADYRMLFFNPDGHPASMCGNGARCVAFFAYRAGIAGVSQRISTDSGIVSAEITETGLSGATVRISMTPASEITIRTVKVASGVFTCYCLDTGVPHAVIFVDNVDAVNVRETGRQIREAKEFAPAGTNVDFAEVTPDGGLTMRVYERGVEDESGACGTGAVASALAAFSAGKTDREVAIRVTSGYTLDVSIPERGNPVLTGPVSIVFEGSAEI